MINNAACRTIIFKYHSKISTDDTFYCWQKYETSIDLKQKNKTKNPESSAWWFTSSS